MNQLFNSMQNDMDDLFKTLGDMFRPPLPPKPAVDLFTQMQAISATFPKREEMTPEEFENRIEVLRIVNTFNLN